MTVRREHGVSGRGWWVGFGWVVGCASPSWDDGATLGSGADPQLAVSDQEVVAVWRDGDTLAAAHRDDGEWVEDGHLFEGLGPFATNGWHPSVLGLADGRVLAAWRTFGMVEDPYSWVGEVWTATFDPDEGWSGPTSVLRAASFIEDGMALVDDGAGGARIVTTDLHDRTITSWPVSPTGRVGEPLVVADYDWPRSWAVSTLGDETLLVIGPSIMDTAGASWTRWGEGGVVDVGRVPDTEGRDWLGLAAFGPTGDSDALLVWMGENEAPHVSQWRGDGWSDAASLSTDRGFLAAQVAGDGVGGGLVFLSDGRGVRLQEVTAEGTLGRVDGVSSSGVAPHVVADREGVRLLMWMEDGADGARLLARPEPDGEIQRLALGVDSRSGFDAVSGDRDERFVAWTEGWCDAPCDLPLTVRISRFGR